MSGSSHGNEGNNSTNRASKACDGKISQCSSSSSDSITDEEEQEDSSSKCRLDRVNALDHPAVEDELSNFRRLWQRDISENFNAKESNKTIRMTDGENNEREEAETKAKKWFLEGVEHEKNGRLIEAIKFYKRAVQLVPDIEFKLCDLLGNKGRETFPMDTLEDAVADDRNDYAEMMLDEESEFEEDEPDGVDLLLKLQRFVTRSKSICRPAKPQTATHISSLPLEIILYILRWVVSHDLDLRSLEMCSMVSRGFYICSRDSEIWRQACIRIWGVNCGNLKSYDSWRTMYLKRPHVNYNGCYISKTTYIRHGETSFQDQFYRPWHVVEYYRYFRFFPEGIVYMLTTPDQPAPVTCILKGRNNRHPSLLTGHYRLQDDRIFIVLQREELIGNKFRKRKTALPVDLIEQTFHIELQVVNRKNRINNCLIWKRYCVISLRGQTETKTSFEVMSNKFPCLWFSRVKSYTSESERPLL